MRISLVAMAGVCVAVLVSAGWAQAPQEQMKVRVTWGHRSGADTAFYVLVVPQGLKVVSAAGRELENGDVAREGTFETRAGGGDVDGADLVLRYPHMETKEITKLQRIWADLFAQSDTETARRLRLDAAYRPDPRRITVQMDREGTKGFTVTVDQLVQNRVMWVPSLDVFVAIGDQPVSLAEHQKELELWKGRRVLEEVQRDAEATYEQYTLRWEDMGSPTYRHPSQTPPGHIIGVGWDSSLYKLGIDRGAGVWSDLGSPDKLRFWYGFGEIAGLAGAWKGQRLTDGLPVIVTAIEKAGVRYEVEQFAYPLNGPPAERRGDMPMVLLAKVKVTNLQEKPASVAIPIKHERRLAQGTALGMQSSGSRHAAVAQSGESRRILFSVEGEGVAPEPGAMRLTPGKGGKDPGPSLVELGVRVELEARGSREIVVKLPTPALAESELQALDRVAYGEARAATLRFWSDWLARGAQFRVPEKVVNDLFRANLWHALRLPRRHGGPGAGVKVDLPYSNFAYGQDGTPWPVNQAVYVDYMLYDLRGYHAVSVDEVLAMYRGNQRPDGRVGGYANWGVYTPGMMYTVAKNYLLSGDREALDKLMPATLKAMDWCLKEIQDGKKSAGGLVRAPLNDLTGDGVWAFNQAYTYAGLDLFGQVLERIGHPRAAECKAAATELRGTIERAFGAAAMRSPLVQLRDHTWVPYVPCEATTSGRLLEQWYPTDVDTGAVHMPRLKALRADSLLTESLLNDHEDNLFLKQWGTANEPVYNQQATVYLLRDDVKAVIRAFYSQMACAFSHSTLEPVEHRWTWGQYFGPPSTDGSWFELYRNMLIHEVDGGTLLLLQATPRKWLEDGKRIEVERAPTYYGALTMTVESRSARGEIAAEIEMPTRAKPKVMLVRLRHPEGKRIEAVRVNGQAWREYDREKEWVRIVNPDQRHYSIVAQYGRR